MALGIQTESGSGDFLPIIKYDARAGRLFRVDRSQTSDGSWDKEDVDITDNGAFVPDFANIEVGWISFAGSQPDFKMVPLGSDLPARPTQDHKQGFRVRVKLAKSCGGDLREFSHTAKAVLGPIDALHTAYANADETKEGKLPIVKLTGTTSIKTKSPQGTTTNYAPVFEIAGWVDRPEDMDGATSAKAAEEAEPEPKKANGKAQHAPPPQSAPAQADVVTEF